MNTVCCLGVLSICVIQTNFQKVFSHWISSIKEKKNKTFKYNNSIRNKKKILVIVPCHHVWNIGNANAKEKQEPSQQNRNIKAKHKMKRKTHSFIMQLISSTVSFLLSLFSYSVVDFHLFVDIDFIQFAFHPVSQYYVHWYGKSNAKDIFHLWNENHKNKYYFRKLVSFSIELVYVVRTSFRKLSIIWMFLFDDFKSNMYLYEWPKWWTSMKFNKMRNRDKICHLFIETLHANHFHSKWNAKDGKSISSHLIEYFISIIDFQINWKIELWRWEKSEIIHIFSNEVILLENSKIWTFEWYGLSKHIF